MSAGLQIPGQVGLGVLLLPGPNAAPVGTSLQEGPNQVRIVVAGGLTKRQDLAARFLPTIWQSSEVSRPARCMSELAIYQSSKGIEKDIPQDAIGLSLAWADALLAATEPQNGG